MAEEKEGLEDEGDGQYHLIFSCCSPSFVNGCWNLKRFLLIRDPILPLKIRAGWSRIVIIIIRRRRRRRRRRRNKMCEKQFGKHRCGWRLI
jgi:hypothetical protein